MQVCDLTKEMLLQELEKENQLITKLESQRLGLSNQLTTERLRRNEIYNEITKRYKEGLWLGT